MSIPRGSAGTPLSQLVYSRERILYGVMVVVSLGVYAGLVMWALSQPEIGARILAYAIVIPLLGWYAHGVALGRVRGNAVRVSDKQFPELYRLTVAHARRLELKQVPIVYLLQSGGLLNAFAARFSGRDFVVINSDVLELALDQGEAAVGFIVGHELAHLWRGHLRHRWLTTPARFVPYLGSAYSRACEYTCDRIGAACQPDGAISGLLALAAGKQLHPHVDVREFAAQAEKDQSYWTRRAELISSHPLLTKRVAALLKAGIAIPARRQLPMTGAQVAA
jgi:Zn-dependent protease with chaperone function